MACDTVQVREGRALAPGMDPEAELKTLRLRFDNFRRDFKVQNPSQSISLEDCWSKSSSVLPPSSASEACLNHAMLSAGALGEHS